MSLLSDIWNAKIAIPGTNYQASLSNLPRNLMSNALPLTFLLAAVYTATASAKEQQENPNFKACCQYWVQAAMCQMQQGVGYKVTSDGAGGFDRELESHTIFDSTSPLCSVAQQSHQAMADAGLQGYCEAVKADCERDFGTTLSMPKI